MTHPEGRQPREDRDRNCSCKPKNTMNCWQLPEAKRGRSILLCHLHREPGPVDTLSSGFYSQNYSKINFSGFKSPNFLITVLSKSNKRNQYNGLVYDRKSHMTAKLDLIQRLLVLPCLIAMLQSIAPPMLIEEAQRKFSLFKCMTFFAIKSYPKFPRSLLWPKA